MSETLRAVDPFISRLGDVTPSKMQRLGRVPSPRDQAYFLWSFANLKALFQEEWSRDPLSFSQSIKAPASAGSEPDEEVRQTAVWLTWKSHLPKAPQFTRQPSYQGSLESNEDIWQTAIGLRTKSHTPWSRVSNRLQDLIPSQRAPNTAWSLLDDPRRANLVAFSQPPEPETELTPDEKRYQELNEKYFNGTITKQEQLELVKIQEALDEADAKDPEVVRLNKGVSEGYDKLHNALRQINRILDEVLTK